MINQDSENSDRILKIIDDYFKTLVEDKKCSQSEMSDITEKIHIFERLCPGIPSLIFTLGMIFKKEHPEL